MSNSNLNTDPKDPIPNSELDANRYQFDFNPAIETKFYNSTKEYILKLQPGTNLYFDVDGTLSTEDDHNFQKIGFKDRQVRPGAIQLLTDPEVTKFIEENKISLNLFTGRLSTDGIKELEEAGIASKFENKVFAETYLNRHPAIQEQTRTDITNSINNLPDIDEILHKKWNVDEFNSLPPSVKSSQTYEAWFNSLKNGIIRDAYHNEKVSYLLRQYPQGNWALIEDNVNTASIAGTLGGRGLVALQPNTFLPFIEPEGNSPLEKLQGLAANES